MSETIRVTREELYAQVWATPMHTLAKNYGRSDVALAKTCRRLRIPLPGRGYWAKKKSGQHIWQRPLPTLPATARTNEREVAFDLRRSEREESFTEGPLAEYALFERDPENRIMVGEREQSRDPLVVATRRFYTEPSHKNDGPPRGAVFNIDVSRDVLPRAMRILSSIVKALRVRGWPLKVTHGDRERVSVTVLGQTLSFSLRELLRRLPPEPPKPVRIGRGEYYTPSWQPVEFAPTGRLVLRIDGYSRSSPRRSWTDGKRQRVESCLNDFMIGLVECAEEDRIRKLEREEFARQWEEARLRRLAEEQERERETARIAAFVTHAMRWSQSQQLLAFLAALRLEVAKRPQESSPSDVRDRWLAWATDHAKQLNPLRAPLDGLWCEPSEPAR